jgi:succinoglycan biosynthesis protein ExoM
METIDICICTFRRQSLGEAIASVRRQAIPKGVAIRVIVIDNDTRPTARDIVQAQADMAAAGAGFGSGVEINYLHAPGRNISLARNAALAASSARYLAFLDDDEVAEPGWLQALWARHLESGAEVVLGPVDPVYPQDAPDWMRATSVHATRPVFVQGEIRTGYTCNVLIDRDRADIRALRFEPELGQSGGEDSDYFARVVLIGGRIDFAPEARVTEPVALDRLSFGWLAERRYRMGLTHAGILMRRHGVSPWRAVPVAGAKLLACACMAVIFAGDRGWRASAALRGVLHAGVVAGLVGRRAPVIYGGTPDGAERP